MPAATQLFPTLQTEGALLPADLLARIAADQDVEGLNKADYDLTGNQRLREAISRSWIRLLGAWTAFSDALAALPEGDPATTLTRERWLLPLFEELGYGRLQATKAIELDGRSYPVSHAWGRVPLHLVGANVPLDRRTRRVAGAAGASPHSLVQELLNHDGDRLWALVSNGRTLRLLRDNVSLTRQAFVEFDLQAMFEGQAYADFSVLWLVCHRSRFEAAEERAGSCWLERWSQTAAAQGTRALDQLRGGVEHAIATLGTGFLADRHNADLISRLRRGDLATKDFYRQLLRLVYRLLFLLVAEDRGLLHPPDADPTARAYYEQFYSTRRLRALAARRRPAGRHGDLWVGLRVVMESLAADGDGRDLALPMLGSDLWAPSAVPDLGPARLDNAHLLDAVRALAFVTDGTVRRPVDYRNLGSEELGSVYESLLDQHPVVHLDTGRFELRAGGNERKTTGSYYTPASLVTQLLDTALDPVLDEAAAKPDPAAAILDLKVVDPACGSGHFLISAAHRMARRLAAARTGEAEPAPEAVRTAVRDVIGRCIYGVDANPMAVELCKVSLWMEALEPGRPLSFLDHHVQCGNSLLGATPALLEGGIPDDAFKPIEGDEKDVATMLRRNNRQQRAGQLQLRLQNGHEVAKLLAEGHRALDRVEDTSIFTIRRKVAGWIRLERSQEGRHARLIADTWCAAFVWPKHRGAPAAPTHAVFRQLLDDPDALGPRTREEVERLAAEYRFFHWHLAFPSVFQRDGGRAGGGFDVVLGNPPWERIKVQDKEFFGPYRPDIAQAPNAAAVKRMLRALEHDDPALHTAYRAALRKADGTSHLLRTSGRYPLCGRGDINTYSVFAETNRAIVAPTGRVGCILPSGIATDDTTKEFFADLVGGRSLVSLYHFDNRKRLFRDVGTMITFCLLTLTGSAKPELSPEYAFFLHGTDELGDAERRFPLTAEDIRLLNPNTQTCPIFRTRRDAEITKAIYRRVPVLVDETRADGNPWNIRFRRMFDMANDSGLFRTRPELEADGWRLDGNSFVRGGERFVPLFEAKMIHQYDHRWATFTENGDIEGVTITQKVDPGFEVLPRYWVPERDLNKRLEGWPHSWLLGWRDIARSTDERTVIATITPRCGSSHKFLLWMPAEYSADMVLAQLANLNSLIFDYLARQKLGGISLTYFTIRQLPMVPPAQLRSVAPWNGGTLLQWIVNRVSELCLVTSALAGDFNGRAGAFVWDEERRRQLRAELDAAFFQLYAVDRDAVGYVLDTFVKVRAGEEEQFGEYRTKRLILDIYDRMANAIAGGPPFDTVLDPPPGQGPRHTAPS